MGHLHSSFITVGPPPPGPAFPFIHLSGCFCATRQLSVSRRLRDCVQRRRREVWVLFVRNKGSLMPTQWLSESWISVLLRSLIISATVLTERNVPEEGGEGSYWGEDSRALWDGRKWPDGLVHAASAGFEKCTDQPTGTRIGPDWSPLGQPHVRLIVSTHTAVQVKCRTLTTTC